MALKWRVRIQEGKDEGSGFRRIKSKGRELKGIKIKGRDLALDSFVLSSLIQRLGILPYRMDQKAGHERC